MFNFSCDLTFVVLIQTQSKIMSGHVCRRSVSDTSDVKTNRGTHAHTRAHTRTRRTRARTRTHAHAHTRARAHARTHAHARAHARNNLAKCCMSQNIATTIKTLIHVCVFHTNVFCALGSAKATKLIHSSVVPSHISRIEWHCAFLRLASEIDSCVFCVIISQH